MKTTASDCRAPADPKHDPVMRRPQRWNHNIQYHRLVLAAVPPGCQRVLDVGCGEGMLARLTHRSSMSMALNLLSNGASCGLRRPSWSGIVSSVAYTRSPCRPATRRAIIDLPEPLPPPIQ